MTKVQEEAINLFIEVFAEGRIHIIFRFEDEYRRLLEKKEDMEVGE